MNRLLDVPWVVNEETERISTHGGLATIDFCGTVAERREAMRLVAQAQAMAKLLLYEMEPHSDNLRHVRDCPVWDGLRCSMACYDQREVLRAAGVLP